jgi:hypothetical protein
MLVAVLVLVMLLAVMVQPLLVVVLLQLLEQLILEAVAVAALLAEELIMDQADQVLLFFLFQHQNIQAQPQEAQLLQQAVQTQF